MNFFKLFNFLAPSLLRAGLSFVFFWFGFSQLENPAQWVSFLPQWVSNLPITAVQLIFLNGIFEIIGGILLLLGVYTNIVAFILSLHLFGIAFSVGLNNAVGVRDIGLATASLSLSVLGAGDFSIDHFLLLRPKEKKDRIAGRRLPDL